MELYDAIIKDVVGALAPFTPKVFPADGEKWKSSDRNEIIFQHDTAYELGGSKNPSASFTVVTSAQGLFEPDCVKLYGNDLQEIKTDTPYAKIVLIQADDFSDDAMKCYNAIKDIEFVAYDVFLKGVMTRISALDRKEQVRISKTALKEGITFGKIAASYIEAYRKNPHVKAVSVIYVTEDLGIFPMLSANAKKVDDITITLNKVLSGMNFDCATCNLKAICDEVEGLRELHFKNRKK